MPSPSRKTKQPRIALATCAAHPRLAPDDRLLAAAIAARGIEAVPVVWNAEGTDWAEFDGCVIRSVWDYHLEPDRFLEWAERVGSTVPTWNPAGLIAWNANKEYLRQLQRCGIPIIPTRWLERGSAVRLAEVLAAEGWERAVIKPTVDLGAKNLRRVDGADGQGQDALDGLLARHDVMVQPFLPSLEERVSCRWSTAPASSATRCASCRPAVTSAYNRAGAAARGRPTPTGPTSRSPSGRWRASTPPPSTRVSTSSRGRGGNGS